MLHDDDRRPWTRRHVLVGGGVLTLVAGGAAVVGLRGFDASDEPTERQRGLLREVSQLVIPRTGTAGAGEVGAADFVVLALAHGLLGSRDPAPGGVGRRWRRSDGSLRHLAWLDHELRRRSRGDFLRRDATERLKALAALDADAFGAGEPATAAAPWRTIKALILTGYYGSQVGASQELRYELVPGRWDPDMPLEPGARAWSSDWTAVDFG